MKRREAKAPAIPRSVAISPESDYEVVWIDGFPDGETLGECRPDTEQIVLSKRLAGRELLQTFIHELLHAIEDEYKIRLSHKAIHQLDEALAFVLENNGWLAALRRDKTRP